LSRPSRSEPYDTKGAALCASTFGLLIAGLQFGAHAIPLQRQSEASAVMG
jgi:hypothetical protein